MNLTLFLALSLATCAMCLLTSWRATVEHPSTPLGLMHLLFAATILWRPTLLLLQLDTLFPEQFQGTSQTEGAARALLLATLWLITFNIAFASSARFGETLRKPFPSARNIVQPLLAQAALLLTVTATVVTVAMWARFGGPVGLIEAAKFQKTLGVLLALRAFPVVATILNLATSLHHHNTQQRRQTLKFAALALLTATLSFTWGARDGAALCAVVMLFGPLANKQPTKQQWARLLAGGTVAVGAIVMLRFARDIATTQSLSPFLEGESPWRQVSVAANLTQFDALVLAVRDTGTRYEFLGASEFVDGFRAAIPGLTPDGYQRTGISYAQQYEPDRANGRPLSSIGDWYISLGVPGVTIGGFLSGLMYRGIATAYRTHNSAIDFVVATFLVLAIAQLGVWTSIFVVYRALFIPLILVIITLRFYGSRTATKHSTTSDTVRERAEA